MALEQTVNKDAASKFGGITAFANSDSAKARWMKTRSIRSKIVSYLLEFSGLSHVKDTKAELQGSRINRDNKDVLEIMNTMDNFLNPFYNIAHSSHKPLYWPGDYE
jgi:hypothetical protein